MLSAGNNQTVIIDISKYKLELLSDIYKNPKIVSAIDSQQTDVTPSEPDTLMYQNLFPYMCITRIFESNDRVR